MGEVASNTALSRALSRALSTALSTALSQSQALCQDPAAVTQPMGMRQISKGAGQRAPSEMQLGCVQKKKERKK